MRRLLSLLAISLFSLSLFGANLSFSGGKSSLTLREGKEEVVLSDGAIVTLDDMVLRSNRIILSGSDWNTIRCEGQTSIEDTGRGLDIRASNIIYDRSDETLTIDSWFEVNDTKEEITAMGGAMYFDMDNEILELIKQVTLRKITDKGIMECNAESIIYDRKENKLSLISSAVVKWNGDEYKAEAITVDLETDNIKLEGRIKGTING